MEKWRQGEKLKPDLGCQAKSGSPPDLTLLCARYWPERHGGVEQRMWHVSQALAQVGAATHVITENRLDAPEREAVTSRLTVHRLPPMDPGRLWRWDALARATWWAKMIRRHAPPGRLWATAPVQAAGALLADRGGDLIYNPACCAAAMAAMSRQAPHLTTLRQPRALIWLDRWAWRQAPAVVVSSENLRRQLTRHYGLRDRTHVVPHGVAMPTSPPERAAARARWGLNEQTFVAGFVGRLDPCKGLELLLEAAALPESKERPFGAAAKRLVLVGEGPDRARLISLADHLGIAERIIWAGSVADPRAAYAAMDVLVLPSVYETFGNVLLEAMAMGVPVIGRQGDGMRSLTASEEIIAHGRTGYTVGPHPADLAARLAELQASPARRAAMGRHALATAGQRPWQAVAATYLEVMGLAAQGDRRRAA